VFASFTPGRERGRLPGEGRGDAFEKGRYLVHNELLVGRLGYQARRDWRTVMLWTILVILLVLWLLGMITSYTMGGLIHVLLVVAVIILLVRLVSGRRVV
jgi:quinol-cytochrome oxidoreductase complex cytochrome b subunit